MTKRTTVLEDAGTVECCAEKLCHPRIRPHVGILEDGCVYRFYAAPGHESIKTAVASEPRPRAALYDLVGRFKGSDLLPSDVYGTVLEELRKKPALIEPIVRRLKDAQDISVAPRAFLKGVSGGACAFDGRPRTATRRRRRQTRP